MTDAITYDDVLLVPSYNHWESRRVVDISVTDKSGKLRLDLPIMSSNMDTITESEMANYIGDIIGGLRSGLTYGGASTIRELQRNLDYITISSASKIESLPHRTLE